MRIGVIGHLQPDSFADNVADSLMRMGHEVVRLGPGRARYSSTVLTRVSDLARQASPRLDDRLQAGVATAALEAGCEAVLNTEIHLAPAAVSRLRAAGVRVAFWYPDHITNIGRQSMLLAPYDALFFKEPILVDRLRSMLGLPAHYLPEACNPTWHRPHGEAGVDPHLVVVGNMYPSRTLLLDRLTAKGIPLRLYGARPPRWLGDAPSLRAHTGRSVVRHEKARVFREAAGVLNNLHPGEVLGVNCRLFEATGCGGAVLTEFRPVLPELFDIGTEVLAFHDFDELVLQAERVLGEDGLSRRLGDAAAKRAHAEHTYDHRLAAILAVLC